MNRSHNPSRVRRDTLLRTLRRRRGLYQYQAAMQFAVTEVSWSRYEGGLLPIPDALLAEIAKAWRAPDLLAAHPCVAAWVALRGDDGPRDPAPSQAA